MFYTVYRITNKINGKFYVGKHKTHNLEDGYMGSGKLIKRAIRKHGIENFIKEILFVYDNVEDMNSKERELVALNENSYNLCSGGQGGFDYINNNGLNGSKLGFEAVKKLISETGFHPNYGRKQSEEERQMRSLIKRGKKLPTLAYKNSIQTRRENGVSQETREKMRLANSNRMFINDGQKNKTIPKDAEIPIGFVKGRIWKHART